MSQAYQQRIDEFLRCNRALEQVLDDTMWTLDFQQVYRTVRDINVQLSRPLLEDFLQMEPKAPSAESKNPSPRVHVSELVIREAISKQQACPITLEPLNVETSVCVAPCYHVFQKSAIHEWHKKSTLCPQCRERCFL